MFSKLINLENLSIPKDVEYKSQIAVMMLNGSIGWNAGCALRNMIDEDLKKFETLLNS